MTCNTFEARRTAALANLARMRAEIQLLADILERVRDVRSGENWHGWARQIEHAHEDLRVAVADVTRNAVI